MIFLPRNDYSAQENCKTIVESELTKNNFSIYGWRQVPVNPKILGEKALQTMPEIIQVLFKSCLLYTSPSPRDRTRSRMPSSA